MNNKKNNAEKLAQTATQNQASLEKWMYFKPGTKPVVDSADLAALEALVLHIAEMSHEAPFKVERQLADTFAVPNIKCLPATAYDAAMRYMIGRMPVANAA